MLPSVNDNGTPKHDECTQAMLAKHGPCKKQNESWAVILKDQIIQNTNINHVCELM